VSLVIWTLQPNRSFVHSLTARKPLTFYQLNIEKQSCHHASRRSSINKTVSWEITL